MTDVLKKKVFSQQLRTWCGKPPNNGDSIWSCVSRVVGGALLLLTRAGRSVKVTECLSSVIGGAGGEGG